MQWSWSKNLKGNTKGKKKRKLDGKKLKKIEKYLAENCQEGIQRNCSMNRATESTSKNIGDRWRKIREGGKRIRSLDTIGTHF